MKINSMEVKVGTVLIINKIEYEVTSIDSDLGVIMAKNKNNVATYVIREEGVFYETPCPYKKCGGDLKPKSFIAYDNIFYEVVDVNNNYALVKDAWNGFYAIVKDQMYDYYGEDYCLFLAEAQDVKESDLTFLHTLDYVFPDLICDVLRPIKEVER